MLTSQNSLKLNVTNSSDRPRKKLDMDKKQKKDGAGGQNSPLETIVTDPHRLNQRQKQIDMGKNTLGYEMYIKHVSR